MKIETYDVTTGMGNMIGGNQLPFLSISEANEINSIGYTGKTTKGEKISRKEYLNSLNKGLFEVRQTKFDFGDYCEEFLIIRVI